MTDKSLSYIDTDGETITTKQCAHPDSAGPALMVHDTSLLWHDTQQALEKTPKEPITISVFGDNAQAVFEYLFGVAKPRTSPLLPWVEFVEGGESADGIIFAPRNPTQEQVLAFAAIQGRTPVCLALPGGCVNEWVSNPTSRLLTSFYLDPAPDTNHACVNSAGRLVLSSILNAFTRARLSIIDLCARIPGDTELIDHEGDLLDCVRRIKAAVTVASRTKTKESRAVAESVSGIHDIMSHLEQNELLFATWDGGWVFSTREDTDAIPIIISKTNACSPIIRRTSLGRVFVDDLSLLRKWRGFTLDASFAETTMDGSLAWIENVGCGFVVTGEKTERSLFRCEKVSTFANSRRLVVSGVTIA